MPVPYEKLTVKDILYHQAAYDCFDDCGRQLFDGWDIIGLEKAALGCGDNHYLYMAEQIRNNPGLFNDLNERMPFLPRFGVRAFTNVGSTMATNYSFLIPDFGEAVAHRSSGHLQQGDSPMTNCRWMSAISRKSIWILPPSFTFHLTGMNMSTLSGLQQEE